jgi:hypothetical protein
MCAASRTVTGVIRAHIKVIGTDRTRRIKAAVGCLLAGVTLRTWTRVSRVYGTGPAAAGVGAVTEEAVITGCRVSRVRTGPRSVTGVIGTYIPVIGARTTWRGKTAVRCLLAGVAFSPGTGAPRMDRTVSATAGVGAVTVEAVVTGCRVRRMCAGPRTVTGVIRTYIPVIGADRPRQVKAAVRIFLAGVALRLGARASRMD